ncbi:metal-dependent transcriptional regulator [Methanoplanus endosymbiosus]|uniref:Metal-dependent transcriptional regulator n=1 Tax=Methanoplanus endosymbiosus TaxID=33865 RepID=A0A9E7PMB9_9EURY|nr:metal-dependent transcriptional regulator [Methanoplanus endosymbiosus]UUX91511.1 metal-dependent transcriptional regulator [Methanoplanus endosymbiosus]
MDQKLCEDYLEKLSGEPEISENINNKKILAEYMHRSISETESDLLELETEGYLTILPDGKISLSDEGIKKGRCIAKKHKVLECFFTEMLGMDPETASKEACEIEHSASDDTIKKLNEYLNRPGRCQGRRQGPRRTPCSEENAERLTLCNEGEKLKVVGVGGRPGRGFRLNDLGIVPGEKIEIIRKLDRRALLVKVKGSEVAISPEIANTVFVERRKE